MKVYVTVKSVQPRTPFLFLSILVCVLFTFVHTVSGQTEMHNLVEKGILLATSILYGIAIVFN